MREHRKVIGDGVVVFLLGRRRDAVGEGEDVETFLVRGPHRGFHATVGQEAAERDIPDSPVPKDEVEVRAHERIQAALALDHDVAHGGCQARDDLRAPRILDEGVALHDPGEDAVRLGADLAVACGERDRRMDDRDTCLSGLLGGGDRVGEHPGPIHHIRHRTVQRATVGGEVVLKLDEDNGGLGRVQAHHISRCGGGCCALSHATALERPAIGPAASRGRDNLAGKAWSGLFGLRVRARSLAGERTWHRRQP